LPDISFAAAEADDGFFRRGILKLTQLHLVSVVASLLGFYVLYLIIEIYFVNGRLHQVKESER
jgi:hypothetical protein